MSGSIVATVSTVSMQLWSVMLPLPDALNPHAVHLRADVISRLEQIHAAILLGRYASHVVDTLRPTREPIDLVNCSGSARCVLQAAVLTTFLLPSFHCWHCPCCRMQDFKVDGATIPLANREARLIDVIKSWQPGPEATKQVLYMYYDSKYYDSKYTPEGLQLAIHDHKEYTGAMKECCLSPVV